MSLWSELKQRRITQIALSYAAAGWIVLAVVDQVVDREVLPPVVYEVTLTLFLFGLAASLIIGWYHGEKGEQKAPLVEIVALGVLLVGALGTSGVVISNAMDRTSLADAFEGEDLRDLAVLYFEDASRDGSMGAVADGISEGLIASLSQVRELDVLSRNAAREARAIGDVPIDSIARVLGVGAVIDGSVNEQGDEIRVRFRISEGATGTQLVTEDFSWPTSQLATVGTDLAEEIALVLREQLGTEIRLREGRQEAPNSAAWLEVARAERQLELSAEAVEAGDVDGVVAALEGAEAALARAREAAPAWARPAALQAEVAYEWFILAGSIDELIETMQSAVRYADEALALDPTNAAALEWRGTARYRRWLAQADDPDELDRLLTRAQDDLERAIEIDPSRASVNSTLSHLYYQVDDWALAVVAAREAYREDAFLDVADDVLWRLYTASYDMSDRLSAEDSCLEGRRRFPHNFRFVQCQLFLLTMPGATPDVNRAWALRSELLPLLTERPDYFEAQATTIVAGVIGLAGQADSARAVFRGIDLAPELNPEGELFAIEGAMRAIYGDSEGAIAALERFVVASNGQGPGEHWWWRNLDGNAAFERLRMAH